MRYFAFVLLVALPAFAGNLVDFSSPDGMKRLERSRAKIDFFPLANHFETQVNKLNCGPTTATILLNTFRLGGETLPVDPSGFDEAYGKFLPETYDPRLHKFTQNTFFTTEAAKVKTKAQVNGEPIEGKPDMGIQLRQLGKMLEAHGLKAEVRVVVDTKTPADTAKANAEIKKEIIANLARANDYVVVNYARKSLSQKGGGHISPLGAYDMKTDSFLVMDVNPNTAPWSWVSSDDLIGAMRTMDTVENRGYLLVSDGKLGAAATAPAPTK